jgi:hypothetical protein
VTEVADLRGDLVTVGDTIAYAATDGRSSGIRVGKILKITEAHTKNDKYWGECHKVPTKIQVEVAFSSGYWAPEKPTTIDASLKRFVKVGA